MGEMPKTWPPEFARRAKENLDLIWEQGSHDVTQMILTLYALVVVPYEKGVYKGIPDRTQEQMREDGWPIEDWCWGCKQEQQKSGLRAFLRMLRHTLAHGHLSFQSDGTNISGVAFSHGLGQNTLNGTWSVDQLAKGCNLILEEIERASRK